MRAARTLHSSSSYTTITSNVTRSERGEQKGVQKILLEYGHASWNVHVKRNQWNLVTDVPIIVTKIEK